MSFSSGLRVAEDPKKTTIYGKFRGVDFSVDPSLVDEYRSPYAPNLISDIGGMPEKRLGWRTLHTVEQPVNGLFYAKLKGEQYYLVHGGTKLYKWTDTTVTLLKSGVNNHRSVGYFMAEGDKDYLYILTGNDLLCFDGTTLKSVEEVAYVPTVLAGCSSSGGGATVEPVNLIGKKRKESFYGTETAYDYQLGSTNIESVDLIEVANASGTNTTLTATTDYTVNLTTGKVTFKAVHKWLVLGQDNIFITYSKAVEGYADRIKKCTIAATYGMDSTNQVFLSGNADNPAKIWYSYTKKPHYFPDTKYTIAGSEENAVIGFQMMGKYLIVVKDDNQQNSTIFQMWATEDSAGSLTYKIEQGVTGVGAISPYSFATLLDEPLFLSRRGIMATYSTNILAERTVKNRSYFIDAQLTTEDNLPQACAVEWNGYYLLAVNNRCYVLDSKNKTYRHNQTDSSADYVYESYHWENFPARCFLSKDGALYFGTADGRICKLNTDILSNKRWNDDTAAVVAIWSTKNDDDGASYLYKTMQKKGCTVTIKPYIRSSCSIYVSKDGLPQQFVRKHLMDIFDWDSLDFERFTFNTNESPQDVYLKKKVKKYKRLQIIIKNNGLDEGFGIFQIAKTFTIGNYAKK